MGIDFFGDDDLTQARRHEPVKQLAAKIDVETAAAEFERLSRASQSNSRGWKFNREKLHERK